MTNSSKLREFVKKSGLKYTYIATKLNISSYCLKQKIDNITEFKSSEIAEFCRILGIEDNLQLKEQLFFANNVD